MIDAGIRVRLTLWYALAVAVVLLLYALAALLMARNRLYAALDAQLHEDREVAEHLLRMDANGELSFAAVDPRESEALGFVLVVQGDDGRVLCSEPAPAPPWQTPVAAAWRGERTLDGADTVFRVHSSDEFVAGRPVVIHVGRSERPLRDDLRGLAIVLLLLLPLAVTMAGAGGWFLARRALAPLVAMTERARIISAERLGERLPIAHPHDELGRLAIVFNETLARLERSFVQLRRFTADASHELRTPLTVLRTVGEVGMQREQGVAGLREVIGSMLEEVDRLTRLVENLLLLTRAEAGRIPLTRASVDLRELVAGVSDGLRVLAEEKNQELTVEQVGQQCVDAILHHLAYRIEEFVDRRADGDDHRSRRRDLGR